MISYSCISPADSLTGFVSAGSAPAAAPRKKERGKVYHAVAQARKREGMSIQKCAKHLGISEANVRKRYERAKKKLIQMREEIPEHQKKTGKGEDEYEYEGNQYRFTRYNG